MENDFILSLITGIFETLLATPDELKIRRFEDDDKVVYFVYTKPGEEGLIIGKNGSLANAIRAVIKAIANKTQDKCVYLDIVDTKREKF